MSTWLGTVSTDWNNALNWGPGGTGAGVPNAGVDAIFDGTATRNCVLGANRTCRQLTFTGFAFTVDFATFTLSASGNITFQANQSSRVLGTTGRLISATSHTITSNTGTWPLDYQIANVVATITIAGDMRIAGSWLTPGSATLIGAFNIYVGTNVTIVGTLNSVATNIIMNGSGTYSGNGISNLEINTTGTVIVTGAVSFTRRFIITAVGSITMTAANVTISNTTTIDLGGRTIGNLTHSFAVLTQTITYSSNVICNNFTIGNGTNVYNGPGRIFANGNYAFNGVSSGSLVVELTGTGTISIGTLGLVCFIAATGNYTLGATLTIRNTFTSVIGAILNTGSSTVTIGASITISTIGVNWNNITVSTGVTVTINALLNITGSLLCSGNATFAGAYGFTAQNFTCTVAASVITFQNINANPLAEYIVNGVLTLIGTAANRITLQAAGSATFNATITPVAQLNYLSGVVPAIGMTVSQATLASPAQLDPTNRPVITGGASPTFTITPAAGAIIGSSLSMRAGYKAKFTLTNGTGSQNVAYTTTQDIDSSAGATITSFGSYSDSIGQPSANLFRTLNWGPLIAPSGSVYYTFVN